MATEKRLIDANDALERLKKAEKEMKVVSICGYKAVPMDAVIDFVASRPTVDAVEVVRCGKCFYYSETRGKDSGKPCGYGSCTKPFHISNIVTNEDFCSFGQRRCDNEAD